MMKHPVRRTRLAVLLLSFVTGAPPAFAQHLPDIVSTDTLRVCSDPGNMPFSEKSGAGFENKIAQIVADELKLKLRYYWLTQGPGFVRNTLGTGLCDVIIGTSGGDVVQPTNPYYRSSYVMVVRKGELSGVKTLADPQLKDRNIGIVAGTPPNNRLGELGLTAKTRAYAAYTFATDRKYQTASAEVIADLAEKKIDVALLWGPAAGWLAKQSGTEMDIVPLLQEPERPPLSFRISMGVRQNENDWKRSLNNVLRKRAADIEKVLREYNVPLLEEEGSKLLEPAAQQ